jgi:hypothetical protein
MQFLPESFSTLSPQSSEMAARASKVSWAGKESRKLCQSDPRGELPVPTIYGMDLPLPKHWQEFEQITRDAMALKWGSPNLTLNGRPGQEQHGVDIYGPDYLGRMTGIQCKRYEGPLKLGVVTEEIGNAEKFTGPLATLYVATTANPDAKLQSDVRLLSEQRSASRRFAVGLLFWEDVVTGLALDHMILAAHYPQLRLDSIVGGPPDASTKLAAINLGYYGRHLSEFYDLTFSDIGWLAGQDPFEFQGILRILSSAVAILPSADRNQISGWLSETDQKLFGPDETRNYATARMLIKRVEDRVKILPSLGELAEANFIELGISMGFVYHSDHNFDLHTSERLFQQVATLFPASVTRLRERVSRMTDLPGYAAGPRLFGFVDAELRWGDASGEQPTSA